MAQFQRHEISVEVCSLSCCVKNVSLAAPKPGPEPALASTISSKLTSADLGYFTLASQGLSFIESVVLSRHCMRTSVLA